MKFYVQYDEMGNISGTVYSNAAPIFERQIEFESPENIEGKRINLETKKLEAIPGAPAREPHKRRVW